MTTARRAAIYVRISDDRAGDAAGVGRQEDDCRALASRQGWTVGQIFMENDTSAFKRRKVRLPDGTEALRVVRPVFRQLLDALASGAMTALIAYDLDRIARDPRDLEDLIDVVETQNIPARSVTGSLDLSSDGGITMARVMVSFANKSSRDTARRVIRKQQELAESGSFAGGGLRSYGYQSDGKTVNEDEAAMVRSIADRIIDGHSLSKVARDLDEAGVPSVKGGKWNARSVHSVVTKPRNIAKRVYRGEIVGDATWPAILDQDVWEQVNLVLATRARGGNNSLLRWLTGTLRCSHCHTLLTGGHGTGGVRYWCATPTGGCGKIAINALHSETTVEALILAYLARPDVLSSLALATSTDAAKQARADAETDEAQLKELAAMWGAKQVTTAEYLTARGAIEERLKTWRGIGKAAAPESVRTLLASDVETTWSTYTPKKRQEVAKVIFPDGIEVLPFDRTKARVFDPARLVPMGWQS